MLVLHAHWQPPKSPDETGGLIVWGETSEAPAPAWQRGRLAQNPRAKDHPFCAPPSELNRLVRAQECQLTLLLPSTRTGPQPSPELVHDWELDRETSPFLAPWTVSGLRLSLLDALQLLIGLPSSGQAEGDYSMSLGEDVHYWHTAASLALETLASQKLLPVLVPVDPGQGVYHARWLPVLDGQKDGPRLAQLEAAMPPVCRAEVTPRKEPPSPRLLLDNFLNTFCDNLARTWGRTGSPRFSTWQESPSQRWIDALFRDDPTVKASPAQLQALYSSYQAWMRNLHAAGDAAFRIAFRLEAPLQQAGRPQEKQWQLHYLLQARDDPSLLVPADSVWEAHGNILSQLGRRFEQPQEKLLAGLGYSARLFPPIARSLKERRPTSVSLDVQGAYTFLREAAPLLEEAGFGLLVPPWWNKPGRRLGVRLRLKPAKRQSADAAPKSKITMENLVSYEWQLSLGETALTQDEFEALVALKSPLVQIRGQWVQLDPEQIEAAIQFWERQEQEGELDLLEALQLGLGTETTETGLPVDEVTSEGWLRDWLQHFTQNEPLAVLPQPNGLRGELRPYQHYGYSWLSFLRRWGLGACLADDMGLGKTIQTIALLLYEKEFQGHLPGPALLVCPTSVVTNWEREVERFAPSLTTLVHQGPNRLRGDEFIQAAQEVDMVLTSYALVRQDIDLIQSIPWYGVILDEAQNIKNPAAKQTQSVRKLAAEFRLALTGTPVENRLSELWSIMHFLNPGYLGSRQAFRRDFALPIERYNDVDATGRLKKLTGPFILRRVKTDPGVIQDLPEKQEMKVYCHMTEEQATLYQAVVQQALKEVEESEGIERRGQVLSMLMQLKQVCNHPAQYLHQVSDSTSAFSKERTPTAIATAAGNADGDLAGRSGKLERLVEMLEEALAVGDRALIFTQFAEMGHLLSAYLPQALGRPVQFLHGGVPVKTRDMMVARFQEDEHGPPIFILSLKAGGTGLNLTRANHVFHFDRWWNPAVENQATDRAFRIGQKRNVLVHKFITAGTLEEMIDEMIESKKGLAEAVVGSGEGWLTELSTDELREVVRLRV